MNKIADALTFLRGVMVIILLLCGVFSGTDAIPVISLLLVLCWVTDVLDGKLARKAATPTRLGQFDMIADLGFGLSLSLCLVLWDIIPLVPLLIVIGAIAVSALVFRFYALQKFIMVMVYLVFTLTVRQTHPGWAWFILGGVVVLAILNPKRTREQVSGFLGEVGNLFSKQENRVDKQSDREVR